MTITVSSKFINGLWEVTINGGPKHWFETIEEAYKYVNQWKEVRYGQ